MRSLHRCDGVTTEQAPLAGDDQIEADPPHAASHQVHDDESGDRESDVTRSGLRLLTLAGLQGICATSSRLQDIVGNESRDRTAFFFGFEAELNIASDGHNKVHSALSKTLSGFLGAESARIDAFACQ